MWFEMPPRVDRWDPRRIASAAIAVRGAWHLLDSAGRRVARFRRLPEDRPIDLNALVAPYLGAIVVGLLVVVLLPPRHRDRAGTSPGPPPAPSRWGHARGGRAQPRSDPRRPPRQGPRRRPRARRAFGAVGGPRGGGASCRPADRPGSVQSVRGDRRQPELRPRPDGSQRRRVRGQQPSRAHRDAPLREGDRRRQIRFGAVGRGGRSPPCRARPDAAERAVPRGPGSRSDRQAVTRSRHDARMASNDKPTAPADSRETDAARAGSPTPLEQLPVWDGFVADAPGDDRRRPAGRSRRAPRRPQSGAAEGRHPRRRAAARGRRRREPARPR